MRSSFIHSFNECVSTIVVFVLRRAIIMITVVECVVKGAKWNNCQHQWLHLSKKCKTQTFPRLAHKRGEGNKREQTTMRRDNAERHLKALAAISCLCLHKSLANYLEIRKPNSTFLDDVKEEKRGRQTTKCRRNHFATTEWFSFLPECSHPPPPSLLR